MLSHSKSSRLCTAQYRSCRAIEPLEKRLLLASIAPELFRAKPTIDLRIPAGENEPLWSSSPTGSTPAQIRHAYGIDKIVFGGGIVGDGSGQTIAIVDAYNNPRIVSSSDLTYASSDLALFSNTFGLPQFGGPGGPTFTKLDQFGGTSYPPNNSLWAFEIALDVEWAHALAPMANIVLIEANSGFDPDLINGAVAFARTIPGVSVISMSFGDPEFAGQQSYDPILTTPPGHNGITFVAGSGDSGAPGLYPAFSPNVLAAGGTTLTLSNENYISETGWWGSGGGISALEDKPSYQSSVPFSATRRTIPDVSFVADPLTGVGVRDSFNGGSLPWVEAGGTSVSAPCLGALIAIANQGRAINGLPTLDGRTETLPRLYTMSSHNFHDIVTGSNGYAAGPGYDLVTGLGTPRADLLVPALAAIVTVPELSSASDAGSSSVDRITNVTLPTFFGQTVLSGTVEILSDGVVVGSGLVVSGNYNIPITTPLTDGTHEITARIGTNTSPSGLSITIDTVAPNFVGGSYHYATLPHQVSFAFSEDVSSSLSTSDLVVSNLTTGQNIPVASMALSYESPTNVANITFPALFYQLPSGNYLAQPAVGASIADLAGNSVAGNISFGFFFLLGDSNHDGRVDVADLGILASNWQQSPRDFTQGDNDYSHLVNVSDLGILASRWQSSLLGSSAPAMSRVSRPRRETLADILLVDGSVTGALPR
jgi:subtilase family serine protease